MNWLRGIVSAVFGWLTAKQETKTASINDQAVKDQRPNLLIQQIIAQITANNFWLIAVETEIALIVMWNIVAYNFGWPVFKTEFDSFQLLLTFCGIHVVKIGHQYSIK